MSEQPPKRRRDCGKGRGVVIKLGKYSCGLYIINEALIRSDTDHTQCHRLDLPGRLLNLKRISDFRQLWEDRRRWTMTPIAIAKLTLEPQPVMILSQYDSLDGEGLRF